MIGPSHCLRIIHCREQKQNVSANGAVVVHDATAVEAKPHADYCIIQELPREAIVEILTYLGSTHRNLQSCRVLESRMH